jgi:toxin YoeB
VRVRLVFSPDAWDQYLAWQGEDMKMVKRINRLIADVQRDPYGAGLGKPEFLKGPLAGWASRRIDDEHRLVYRMRDGALEIAACYGHYAGK